MHNRILKPAMAGAGLRLVARRRATVAPWWKRALRAVLNPVLHVLLSPNHRVWAVLACAAMAGVGWLSGLALGEYLVG